MDTPIAGEHEIKAFGCVINQVLNMSGVAQCHVFYAVRHLKTNQVIDVVSLVQAYHVAKLLELESLVSQWMQT